MRAWLFYIRLKYSIFSRYFEISSKSGRHSLDFITILKVLALKVLFPVQYLRGIKRLCDLFGDSLTEVYLLFFETITHVLKSYLTRLIKDMMLKFVSLCWLAHWEATLGSMNFVNPAIQVSDKKTFYWPHNTEEDKQYSSQWRHITTAVSVIF